jgi:hypothetical protein
MLFAHKCKDGFMGMAKFYQGLLEEEVTNANCGKTINRVQPLEVVQRFHQFHQEVDQKHLQFHLEVAQKHRLLHQEVAPHHLDPLDLDQKNQLFLQVADHKNHQDLPPGVEARQKEQHRREVDPQEKELEKVQVLKRKPDLKDQVPRKPPKGHQQERRKQQDLEDLARRESQLDPMVQKALDPREFYQKSTSTLVQDPLLSRVQRKPLEMHSRL